MPDIGSSGPDDESNDSIRVVVVSSAPLLAHGISALLRTDPEIELVGELPAECLQQRLDPGTSPDIVLIECLLATGECAKLVRCLSDEFPLARILVVCRDLHDRELSDLVAAGALGYVTPQCGRDELLDAIRRVSQGEVLCPTPILMRLLAPQRLPGTSDGVAPDSAASDASTDPRTDTGPSGADQSAPLAPRERQVLEAMATGLSTDEVAEQLGITVHTVRTHLRNVLLKLSAHSKLEAVVIALRRGLIELPRELPPRGTGSTSAGLDSEPARHTR